jgi:hypothetical protein
MKWFLLSLILTGCVSTNPASWTLRPDEQTATRAAIASCQAERRAIVYQHIAFGGAIMPLIGLGAGNQAYNECMKAQGYVKE